MATLIGSGSVASGGDQLQELFAPPAGEVPAEVLAELLAIQRLHGLDPQELFYRWESFCINGGTPADSVLNLDTARALRRTMQEALERDSRARAARKGVEGSRRPGPSVTPRQSSDVFEM